MMTTGRRAQATPEPSGRRGGALGENTRGSSPLGRRVFSLRNVGSFLLALVALYLVYRQLLGLDWGEVWASVRGAKAWLFALAFLIFYCSFPLRALRWETLLNNIGYSRLVGKPIPSVLGLSRIMYLAWFANCLTVARLGDVYRGYLLKKQAGVSFAATLGTVLAERLLDLIVLVAVVGAGVLVVFGGTLPTEATQALIAGLILSAVGILGLLTMRRFRGALERLVPERFRSHYTSLTQGLVGSFRHLPLLVAYSALGWMLEGATLYTTAAAVGAPISVVGALVVALVGSLLTTVPFTPGGVGFTEAGLVLMLGWLGLDIPTASAVTLLFRLINYWSIVVLGFILYVFSPNTNQLSKRRIGMPSVPMRIHRSFIGRS